MSQQINECQHCHGTGQELPECPTCDGNGWEDDPDDGGTMTCAECDDEKCSICKGTGEIETKPILVHLMQCCRAKCGHILTKEEYAWEPSAIGRRAICPRCGCDSFYALAPDGQILTMKQRDEFRDGIDPETIEPFKRLGPKKRQALLEAKRRILQS